MMRVAIAGTGGLAYLIAHYIHTETGHPLIVLSRSAKPDWAQRGIQIVVVNYNDQDDLRFALTGVNVVISTVPSTVQINLINAAIKAGVRRFAPAEFEGRPARRPVDALDRGKAAVLAHLEKVKSRIEWTVFACGILYERFAPGGMFASNIGLGSFISGEGDYMLDIRNMRARIPHSNAAQQHVMLCMTAAQDVGRFVVQALDLRSKWPKEMMMCGERMSTQQLVETIQTVRGQWFSDIVWYTPDTLRAELASAQASQDGSVYYKLLHLVATEEGRFDFDQANLNTAFPAIQPVRFQDWLQTQWASS